METLTSIVNAENERRERARNFEVAQLALSEARRKVERLTIEPNADAIKRLTRICEDANALPKDIIGSVGGLIPISGEVRVFVHALAASGLNGLLGRDQQRVKDLAAAKAALVKAEEAFKEFE